MRHCRNPSPILKGTRQGCPLFPLLYAIAIKPLANWIRGDTLLKGFEWGLEVRDDIALYAEDIFIFLEDQEKSGSRALQILHIFGGYTGLTINTKKSIVYPLGIARGGPEWAHNLIVQPEGFKYLGV